MSNTRGQGPPLSALPQLRYRDEQPIEYHDEPLARQRCPNNCRQHPEHIYIACFGTPTKLRDRDYDRRDTEFDYPIHHYVGWTRQQPPVQRVIQHGVECRDSLIVVIPGTTEEEYDLKLDGMCPKCSRPLWYYQTPRPLC